MCPRTVTDLRKILGMSDGAAGTPTLPGRDRYVPFAMEDAVTLARQVSTSADVPTCPLCGEALGFEAGTHVVLRCEGCGRWAMIRRGPHPDLGEASSR